MNDKNLSLGQQEESVTGTTPEEKKGVDWIDAQSRLELGSLPCRRRTSIGSMTR